MARYTEIDSAILESLLGEYAIGALVEFSPLSGGWSNSSFKIKTDRGTFILTVSDEKDFDEIQVLGNLMLHLEKHGFSTCRLVQTTQGKINTQHDGKPVYLKEYIEGDVIDTFNNDMAEQTGRALGTLHAIPPHPDMPKAFAYGLESFDEVIESGLENEFTDWLKSKKKYIQESMVPGLPTGLVHGDVFFDNVLFHEGALVAILDFEEACHTFKVFDLGMIITGCCAIDNRISLELVKSMISGYQSVRKLEDKEKQVLPVFIEYGAAATAFWRFRQNHIRLPNSERAQAHLEMSVLADQIHSLEPDEFKKRVF